MTYVVFSQEEGARVPTERLAVNAARFFDATLEVVEEGPSWAHLRVTSARLALCAEFRIDSHPTSKSDLDDAHEAEARGRAGGMGALAEKCRHVWVIEPVASDPDVDDMTREIALLTLAATAASVALGPVLPPDHATLFGVRGALERRDRAVAKRV